MTLARELLHQVRRRLQYRAQLETELLDELRNHRRFLDDLRTRQRNTTVALRQEPRVPGSSLSDRRHESQAFHGRPRLYPLQQRPRELLQLGVEQGEGMRLVAADQGACPLTVRSTQLVIEKPADALGRSLEGGCVCRDLPQSET